MQGVDDDERLRQRVEAERHRRFPSVREAARVGGISNTTWDRYEKGGKLTGRMRLAVAQAFDWPTDWDQELSQQQPDDGDVRGQVARLAEAHQETAETLAVLLGEFAALKRRVDGIEDQRVAR